MSPKTALRVLAQFQALDGYGLSNHYMARALGISQSNLKRIKAIAAQRAAAERFAAMITDRLVVKIGDQRATPETLKAALLQICEEISP